MNEFSSLTELRNRIKPAIETKLKELKANYYTNINEDDIWEYLKNSWKNKTDLTLYDIVNDILNLDNETINEYVLRRINND